MRISLLTILFLLIFAISNDETLKLLGSVNLFTVYTIFIFFPIIIYRSNKKIKKNIVFFFLALTVFLLVRVLISSSHLASIDYDWATGINSPEFRGISFLIRIVIAIASFILLLNIKSYNSLDFIYKLRRVLTQGAIVLSAILIIQFLLEVMFNYQFLYIYNEAGILRYGGWVGEPQTAGLLILPGALFIATGVTNQSRIYTLITITALYLTYSTAVILAFLISILLFYRSKIIKRPILIIIIGLIGFTLSAILFGKINQDILNVSSRSITILAGIELIPRNLFFGTGVGLSPFFLEDTNIFQVYSTLNFTNDFRQNIMSSPIEFITEFGVIGCSIVYFPLKNYISTNFRKENLLPIIGLTIVSCGVGSLFYSPIFICCLLLCFDKKAKTFRQKTI